VIPLKLSQKQVYKISDIFSDMGVVMFASVVLPSILDKFNIYAIGFGIVSTLTLWFISIKIRK